MRRCLRRLLKSVREGVWLGRGCVLLKELKFISFFLVLPISLRYSGVSMLTILLIREDLIGWVHMNFGSCEALGCFAQGVVKERHCHY